MMFYIPFLYTIKTRIYTFPKFLSWVILYLIPLIYLILYHGQNNFNNLWVLLFCVILIYDIYEVGYIQNDAETIKKEVNPTKRLSDRELSYYEAHKWWIYSTRIIWSVIGSAGLLIFLGVTKWTIVFLCMLYLLIPCYLIYNSIRNKWNLLVNFILISIRYLAPLIVLGYITRPTVFTVICIYPLINFIERAATSKFGIPWFKKIIPDKQFLTIFRVLYYTVLLLIFAIYHFLVANIGVHFILVAYFFCFRLLLLLLYRKGKLPKNYLHA